MLTVRFKNPYRNDEPPLSDDEIEEKNPKKFEFKDDAMNVLLEVKEFDNAKFLAPKGINTVIHTF